MNFYIIFSLFLLAAGIFFSIRKQYAIGIGLCIFNGLLSGIVTLSYCLHAYSHMTDPPTLSYDLRTAFLFSAIMLGSFITALLGGICALKNAKRRTTQQFTLDKMDQHLMETGMMPVQKRNQRIFRKQRKQERKRKPTAADSMSHYKHLEATEDVIILVNRIKLEEPEPAKAMADLAWRLAQENNTELDWNNPTIPMTKAVYDDIHILYDILQEEI